MKRAPAAALARLSPSLRAACQSAAAEAHACLSALRGSPAAAQELHPGTWVPRLWEGLGRCEAELDPRPPRSGRFVQSAAESAGMIKGLDRLAPALRAACRAVGAKKMRPQPLPMECMIRSAETPFLLRVKGAVNWRGR